MNTKLTPLLERLSSIILGKEPQIKLALTCLLAKGHLLIEDLPGMGKTSLSHALANSLGLTYQRIQFTSDLLPSDVTGSSIFNTQDHQFEFHQGPIFNQVVLADEINRAGPKTQSALLEAMEEHQVTVDGKTHSLPQPFFVIATQNPTHQAGTFALPESQLDRFLMRIQLGYPNRSAEREIVRGKKHEDAKQLTQAISPVELQSMQHLVEQVTLSDAVLDYILDLVDVTRSNSDFPIALSPRASIGISRCAKAWAFIHGRNFVTHDDVKAIFPSVVEHRLNLNASFNTNLADELINRVGIAS